MRDLVDVFAATFFADCAQPGCLHPVKAGHRVRMTPQGRTVHAHHDDPPEVAGPPCPWCGVPSPDPVPPCCS